MHTSILAGGPRIVGVLALLSFTGCSNTGDYDAADHQVDSETAKSTLISVLDGWKAGDKPDAWQQKTPSVVIQDLDWIGGAKLTNYEIISETAIDANLHCEVKLSFAGREREREDGHVPREHESRADGVSQCESVSPPSAMLPRSRIRVSVFSTHDCTFHHAGSISWFY